MGKRRPSEEEEEESEEEFRGRRVSHRITKKVKKIDYYDDEDDDEEEEDHEQPCPSNSFNQKVHEDKVWLVTCGEDTGFMDLDKFQRGEPCIQCDDQCFLPQQFEFFGGKGSNKKWKESIRYKNEPLRKWMMRGVLSTIGFKKGRTRTRKKKTSSSSNSSDSSSENLLLSDSEDTEDSENDGAEDEDWLPASEELGQEGEEERAGAENEDGDSEGNEREKLTSVANGDVEGERRVAIQKKLKVVLEKLPQMNSTSKSDCMERTVEDRRGDLLSEDSQEERERFPSPPDDPSDTAAPHDEPLQLPVEAVIVIDEGTEDTTQSSEGGEDAQREHGPEAATSQTRSAADNKPEILNETNVGGSVPDHPSTSCHLDTMDLEQLKKEKIKMQLKVLKLQEEYYSLKIKEHKRGHKH